MQFLMLRATWRRFSIHPVHLLMPSPAWLVRWRDFLERLFDFVEKVNYTVLLYSAVSMAPNLKGRVLNMFGVPSSARTLLSTTAALAAKSALEMHHYVNQPDKCERPGGLRSYATAGIRIQICDLCSSRWVLNAKCTMVAATPKAHPSAKTPLGLTKASVERGGYAASSTARASHESSRPSSTLLRGSARSPAATTKAAAISKATSKATASPEPPTSTRAPTRSSSSTWTRRPQRRQWRGSQASDMSVDGEAEWIDYTQNDQQTEEFVEPNWWDRDSDHLEGSEGSRFDPNDLIPDLDEHED